TYNVERHLVEIRAFQALAYTNSSHFFTFVIRNGPSNLTPVTLTSQVIYIGELIDITVNYTTGIGNPISLASVSFNHAFLGSQTLTETGPGTGIYRWTIDSQLITIGVYTIQVKAQKQYLEAQTLVYVIDLRATSAELLPLGEASDNRIAVEYLENFTITVVMYDTVHDTNVSSAKIESFWNGYPTVDFNLTEYVVGYSFYTFEFPANLSIGTWELTLRWLETP
ncbi:MAG: hypothetical protein ACFE8O_11845, partial [Candidatus Hermodarchaeota archaeon]